MIETTPAAGRGQAIPRLPMLAALVPVVVASFVPVAFAVVETTRDTPLSYGRPLNLAEAAGMGRGSEVVRLLRQGEDPRQIMFVRPEIISSSVTRVTALEASVWSRRVQLLRLLDRQTPPLSADERQHLACVAKAIRNDEGAAILVPGSLPGCDPEATMREIQERR